MNNEDRINFKNETFEVNELHFIPFDCYLNDNVYISLECNGLDEKSFDSEDYLSGEDMNSELIKDEESTNVLDNEQVLTEALDLLKLSENKINRDTNCKKIPAIETYADTDEYTSHDEGNGWPDKDDNEIVNANSHIDFLGDEEIVEAKPKTDNLINKKDPAYRPRKGWFFQHDTRDEAMSDDGVDENLANQKNEKRNSNEGNLKTKMDGRWTHDLFDEYEQSPKTPEEILLHYGHDIRDEDTTSNGRRSRKFRRNIPKYNRDWQDADAYNKKRYPPQQAYNHLQAEKNISTTNRIPPKKFVEDRGSSKPQRAFHNEPSSPSRYNNRYRDHNDENKPPPLNQRFSKGNDYKTDPYKVQNTGNRAKHNSESSFNGREGGGRRREEDQGAATKRYSHTRQSFPPPQNETHATPNRYYNNRPSASGGGGRDKENFGPLKDNNYVRSNNYARSSNYRERSGDNNTPQQHHRQYQRGNAGSGLGHLREISPNAPSNYRGSKENERYYGGKRSSPSKRGDETNAMQHQSLGGGTKAYTKSRKPVAQEEAAQASHQQNHNERYGGKPFEQGKMFSQQAYAQPLMSLQDGMVQVSPTHPLLTKAPQNLFTSASAFLTQNQQQQQPMFYPPIQQVLMQRNNLNNMPSVYAPPNNMSVNSLPYLRLAPQLSQGLFANPYLSSGNHNFVKSPLKVQNTLASTTFYNNESFPTPDQVHYLDNNAPFEDNLDVANASFPYPFYSPFSFVNPQTHLHNFGLQDPSLLQNASNTILHSFPNFGIQSHVVDNNHNDEIQHHSFPNQDSDIKVNNSNTIGKIKMNQ